MASQRKLYRADPAKGIERGKAGVDRAKRVVYGVSVISEGEAMGHGLEIDGTTLDQVVGLSKESPRGVKARFGHPLMSTKAEGTFLGRMVNFRRVQADGEKGRVRADLFLSDTAFSETANNIGEYVMDLAEEDSDAFGTSIVFDPDEPGYRTDEDGKRLKDPKTGEELLPLARVKRLWAADVVDEPATGDGLFARTVELSATFTEQLDALLEEPDAAETAQNYLRRYAASRNIDPEALRESVSQLFAKKSTPPREPAHGGAAATAAQTSTPTEEVRGMAGTSEQGSPAAGAPQTDALAIAHKREVEDAKVQAAKDAAAAERSRVTTIQRLGVKLGVPDAVVQEAVDQGMTVEAATQKFTALDAATLQAVKPAIVVGKDEREQFATGAEASFGARLGYADAKSAQDVRKSSLRGLSLVGLARRCLEFEGEHGVTTMSNEDVVDHALSLARRTQFGPGMQATPDFTSILSNVANKALARGWELALTTYQVWCGSGNLSDYKQASLIKGTEFSDDMLIPEGEAARHGSFSDTHEHAQLSDYGRQWCLSRQALINDDLNWFQRVPQRMAAASRRSLNRRVYDYLFGAAFAGPAIAEDATTVFTAAHGNLVAIGAGAAVTDTTVNAGWNAMATQALPSPDGGRSLVMYGNIRPRFLLHGPFNTMNVNRVLASEYLTQANETGAVAGSQVVNTFGPRGTRNGVIPIEESVLDFLIAAPATRPWYLAADPNAVGTITVYYLNGKETPTVSREEARISEPDGVSWKIMHTYAIAAEDFRGLFCNAGR